MAATLTAGADIARLSIPIGKAQDTATINPVDGTPDIEIWGKVSDGTLDSDLQIVDPDASERWVRTWFDTGANIRMAHDPRKPVGTGIDVDGHYVKALIADPTAKHLVRSKVLRDFSIGIMHPDIRVGDPRFRHLDPHGRAVKGIITDRPDGLTQIGEISIVDRGSNYGSSFQIAKAAADGSCEITGKMIGGDDVTAKAAAGAGEITGTVRFSPADLAKLLGIRRRAEEREATKAAEPGGDEDGAANAADDEKDEPDQPDEDTDATGKAGRAPDVTAVAGPDAEKDDREFTAQRRRELAEQGHALPDGSYPIPDKDALRRAAILARSGHGNVKAARKLIARRARELGAPNPLDDDDKVKKAAKGTGKTAARAARAACPSCGKKGRGAHCGACGEAMAAKAATPGDGVTGERTAPVPAHREPDGPAMEALERQEGMTDGDDPAGGAAKSAGSWRRLRALSVPLEDGRLHDFLCPAYDPSDVARCYPGASLAAVIDPQAWQAKALAHAADAPLRDAHALLQGWQDAISLKGTDPGEADWLRREAHYKFADANPGPRAFPTPSELSAGRFSRPLITAGHAAPSPGHDAPRSHPVPHGQVSAAQFSRPFLSAGEAADSPSNHHDAPPAPAPSATGRPERTFYRNTSRDRAREAMGRMHDHIAGTFPDLCPMRMAPEEGQPAPQSRPVPVPSGMARKAAKAKAGDGKAKGGKVACECGRKVKPSMPFCPGCGKKAGSAGPAPKAAASAPGAPAAAPDADVTKAALASLEARLASQQALIDEMAAAPDPRYAPFKAAAAGGVLAKALGALPEDGAVEKAASAQRAALADELRERVRSEDHPARREEAWNALMSLLSLPAQESGRR